MNLRDILWLGLKGMSERKLRTGLTVLSVVIGVAAIVALVALASGISAGINQSLASIGPTTLYIVPRGSTIFTDADVAEIQTFPNVSAVIPLLRFDANVTVDGTSSAITVVGVNNYSIAEAVGGVNLYAGTTYNASAEPEALVGHDIAFPTDSGGADEVQLDEPLYITTQKGTSTSTITLVPVGILDSYGSSLFISPDSSIFIPLTEAEDLLDKYSYNVLLVKATNTSTVNALDTLLTDVYGSAAEIVSVQELSQTVSSITGELSLLLGGIASISLIVAGISILSIMMVSVTERTHEIGVLKSIGFRNRDVMVLFLSEALVIGILGGVAGCVVGGAGSYALTSVFSTTSSGSSSASTTTTHGSGGFGGGGGSFGGGAPSGAGGATFVGSTTSSSSATSASAFTYSPKVTPELVVAAILLAVVVSIAASLYPAWKASTVDPITALRTE